MLDPTTGEFHAVTSNRYNDGLVPGRYKVILTGTDHSALPAALVPLEYASAAKTPLEIDTVQQPLVLKVRKPSQPRS